MKNRDGHYDQPSPGKGLFSFLRMLEGVTQGGVAVPGIPTGAYLIKSRGEDRPKQWKKGLHCQKWLTIYSHIIHVQYLILFAKQ